MSIIAQINAMTLAHQQELQSILAAHAAEHSTSKIAELTSKVSTQEVLIEYIYILYICAHGGRRRLWRLSHYWLFHGHAALLLSAAIGYFYTDVIYTEPYTMVIETIT